MSYRIDPSIYDGVPLVALRSSIRTRLSMYLNSCSDTDIDGLSPDYRGLAEMVHFTALEIKHFERQTNPTSELLEEWNARPGATVGNLCRALLQLQRYDVLVDVGEHLEREVNEWKQRQNDWTKYIQPLQDQTVSQSEDNVDEPQCVVVGDVGSSQPKMFDAFVCYALQDLQFVKEMIERLESPPHNLLLCVPERDILPGMSEKSITASLIEKRCRKVLVLVSPDYLNSPACDFQTKFAQALSPGARSKRVIPVLLKNMSSSQIPNILLPLTWCNYANSDLNDWFWMRMVGALRVPVSSSVISTQSGCATNAGNSPISLNAIRLNLASSPWSLAPCSSESSGLTNQAIGPLTNSTSSRPWGSEGFSESRSMSCVVSQNNNAGQDRKQTGPFTEPITRSNVPSTESLGKTHHFLS